MDSRELEDRVDGLLREKNYIGAYGRAQKLPESDGLRIDLTGKIANAISEELSALRGQNPERQAYLRAQLAWVCRDVPGLSYLYREQLRARTDANFDLLKSIKDLASGRPEDAADRLRRGVEDVQESINSGQAGDRIQGMLKDVERNMRDGAKQVGAFIDSMISRGEGIRKDSAKRVGDEPADGSPGNEEPSVKIEIEKGDEDRP
jgi:hypothetical protein